MGSTSLSRPSMPAEPIDNDLLLARLLGASVEERQEVTADLLAEHVLPVIDRILGSRLQRLGPGAAAVLEDLRGDIVVRLLHRLQRLVADPVGEGIRSFRDYAAVVAYHRLDDFVRSTQPARAALANRVRYVCQRTPGLALWPLGDGELLAGRAADRAAGRLPVSPPVGFARRFEVVAQSGDSPRELRVLIDSVLAALGGPVEMGQLVTVLAEMLHVREAATRPPALPRLVSADPDPLSQLASQDYLRRLWQEIVALPVRQRIALLLNLRDGRGDSAARLLPVTGIAAPAEIGRLLELDIPRFAELWAELPLDDKHIAELLSVTRQQVINLRKSARERLARRMARLG